MSDADRMTVRVNLERCEGHALCAGLAPTVFEINDDDQATVADDKLDRKLWPDVRAAENACPVMAITVTEEHDSR